MARFRLTLPEKYPPKTRGHKILSYRSGYYHDNLIEILTFLKQNSHNALIDVEEFDPTTDRYELKLEGV